MKKYLPSLDELATGVIIVVVGMLVWTFVGAPLVNAVGKVKSKVTGA